MFAPSMATLVEAVKGLGWNGDVVGPLSFGGARFWAVTRIKLPDDFDDGEPEVQLAGCLIAGAPPGVVREASLLAAYAPRAVLVGHGHDLTGLLVDAAMLDQGVVAVGAGGAQVLATAGPRVKRGPVSIREQLLHDEVLRAWRMTRAVRLA
jgi:hypothetical protein